MYFSRIRVSRKTGFQLSNLSGRLRIKPNLLCRMAFCLSLNEDGVPDPTLYESDAENTHENGPLQEFNRSTLTGQWDSLFIALLRERLKKDGLDPNAHLEEQFRAHICRGVDLLSARLKKSTDIERFLPKPLQHSELVLNLNEDN